MDITISNPLLTASFKRKGAELISLKNTETTEYMWEGNPEFWGKHSPVLFPIVGTLKQNTYRLNDQDYTMGRHGFARDLDFEIASQSENSITFALKASDGTRIVYPFYFELQITYTLAGNQLEIRYDVANTGSSALPFSIGAHPAFALPGNFEDYSLQFSEQAPDAYYLLQDDLLSDVTAPLHTTAATLPLNYSLFENDALVFRKNQVSSIAILHNSKERIRVHFKGFPFLGIWTKDQAPFLCIEPWYGVSDTVNSNQDLFEKEGITILQPKENFMAKFAIEIV